MSDKLSKLVASFFYIGHIPWAPGTFGSAAGLAIFWFVPEGLQIVLALFVSGCALWACPGAVRIYKSGDPSRVVVDEVAGMMASLVLLPKNIWVYLAAFLIFRFFDIAKPGPIRSLQNRPGPSSIVWDDLLAGVFTNAVVRLLLFLGGSSLLARLGA